MSHFINHTSSHSKFYKSAQQIRCQWEASGCVTSQGKPASQNARAAWLRGLHRCSWGKLAFICLNLHHLSSTVHFVSPKLCPSNVLEQRVKLEKPNTEQYLVPDLPGHQASEDLHGGDRMSPVSDFRIQERWRRSEASIYAQCPSLFFPTLSHSSCLI